MYVFLFTIPTEIYFYFATERIAFGRDRCQRPAQTCDGLSVLYDVYIVDAAFARNIQVNAPAVSAYHVTHERVVEAEVYSYLIACGCTYMPVLQDRKSTRLNSSHANISYAVFCLKKKNDNCVCLRFYTSSPSW